MQIQPERLLTDLRARATDAEPVRVMYCMPDADGGDEFRRYRETARQLAELGVDWLLLNGQGSTTGQAVEWIEKCRLDFLYN